MNGKSNEPLTDLLMLILTAKEAVSTCNLQPRRAALVNTKLEEAYLWAISDVTATDMKGLLNERKENA